MYQGFDRKTSASTRHIKASGIFYFLFLIKGGHFCPGMSPTTTVIILLFVLLLLAVFLVFFYKKLNREADGKYTVRNMVYREGGIRDRVRGAALTVGSHLGVQLWPGAKTEEDGEEMQEIQDEEGQVEDGDGQGSYSEEEDREDSDNQGDKRKGNGEDTTDDDDTGSLASNQDDQAKPADQQDALGGTEEKKVENKEGKGELSGGTGLLIDLKQFSGSAIWSDEGGCDSKDGDVTAL